MCSKWIEHFAHLCQIKDAHLRYLSIGIGGLIVERLMVSTLSYLWLNMYVRLWLIRRRRSMIEILLFKMWWWWMILCIVCLINSQWNLMLLLFLFLEKWVDSNSISNTGDVVLLFLVLRKHGIDPFSVSAIKDTLPLIFDVQRYIF